MAAAGRQGGAGAHAHSGCTSHPPDHPRLPWLHAVIFVYECGSTAAANADPRPARRPDLAPTLPSSRASRILSSRPRPGMPSNVVALQHQQQQQRQPQESRQHSMLASLWYTLDLQLPAAAQQHSLRQQQPAAAATHLCWPVCCQCCLQCLPGCCAGSCANNAAGGHGQGRIHCTTPAETAAQQQQRQDSAGSAAGGLVHQHDDSEASQAAEDGCAAPVNAQRHSLLGYLGTGASSTRGPETAAPLLLPSAAALLSELPAAAASAWSSW